MYSFFSTTDTEESVAVDDKSSNEVESSEARDNDTSIQRQTEGEYINLTQCFVVPKLAIIQQYIFWDKELYHILSL